MDPSPPLSPSVYGVDARTRRYGRLRRHPGGKRSWYSACADLPRCRWSMMLVVGCPGLLSVVGRRSDRADSPRMVACAGGVRAVFSALASVAR